MTKKIRVKSKTRFLVFILVCLFAVCGVFNGVTGAVNAVASDNHRDYISINVNPGDTLWHIAELYMPEDMDIREAVYIIKKKNNISSDIRAGQTILVPRYDNE